MDAGRIGSGKSGHCRNALPIRDRHELGLTLAIFPERLNPQRCLDQGLDPNLVVVRLVLVGPLRPSAAAPDPSNGRTPRTALVLHGSCSSGQCLLSIAAVARPVPRTGRK